MKLRKKSMIFMLVMTVLMACGCAADKQKTVESSMTNTETAADEKTVETYPMTLIDQAGREVTLEKQPKCLVSSYYITTSLLLALDLEDELKGIESNPEKRPLYDKCQLKLEEMTQVGSPKEFDLEACAALQPELVILPMRAKDMVEPLEKLGIPVMIVNPESQTEIIEMINLIGKAADRTDRAQELVGFIQEKTDFLKQTLADCEKPSVYLGGNSSFLSTASKGMYQNDLISLAGGSNVAGDIDDTYWVESSYEQILDWNPQVIVLAPEASYSIEELQADPGLKDCQAMQNQKIYRIPSDLEAWDSPVPSSILGAVYLASVLHPDLVSNEQYENMVEEYYETFYGLSAAQK